MEHTPHVYYWSHPTTRGTESVATRLTTPTTNLQGASPPSSPYILMTPTYAGHPDKGGYLPSAVKHWLKDNNASKYMVGVIGTGNLNWGKEYCAAADEISERFNIPVLYRVDLRGNSEDIDTIDNGIQQHWSTLCRIRIDTLKAKT